MVQALGGEQGCEVGLLLLTGKKGHGEGAACFAATSSLARMHCALLESTN